MPTARRAAGDAAAVATALRGAAFVRVLARADGDSLAASGLLAAALRDAGVPFQVRTCPDPASTSLAVDDDATTVTIGATGGDVAIGGEDATDPKSDDGADTSVPAAVPSDGTPASVAAFEMARALDADPDPVLALAGAVAGGATPGEVDVLAAAEEAGAVERRPGVCVPTADLGDGLAHSTLVHAPFSGDPEAARASVADLSLPADLDSGARRAVASLVAIEAASAAGATPRAAEAVERALRPHATPGGPFATVEGYADVLRAVARERPGTGVALALGHDARAPALDAWREHARAVHAALRGSRVERYDGVAVVRVPLTSGGRLRTTARLFRDFRSPEPVALAAGDGAAAAASVDPIGLGAVTRRAVERLDGDARTLGGDARRGGARFDGGADSFVEAFRTVLAAEGPDRPHDPDDREGDR